MEPEWIDAVLEQEKPELNGSGPRPVFADFPSPEPAAEAPAPRKNGNRVLLLVLSVGGIVLTLAILALLLPPISLFDIFQEDKTSHVPAFIDLSTASPRLEVEGLTIEVSDITEEYGVRVVSISADDYLRHQIPDEGWFCVPPVAERPLASRVYSLTQTGTPPNHFMIRIVPTESASQETLAMYRWNMTLQVWELIPSQVVDHQVVVEMIYLPPCVVLFADAESPTVAPLQ